LTEFNIIHDDDITLAAHRHNVNMLLRNGTVPLPARDHYIIRPLVLV